MRLGDIRLRSRVAGDIRLRSRVAGDIRAGRLHPSMVAHNRRSTRIVAEIDTQQLPSTARHSPYSAGISEGCVSPATARTGGRRQPAGAPVEDGPGPVSELLIRVPFG